MPAPGSGNALKPYPGHSERRARLPGNQPLSPTLPKPAQGKFLIAGRNLNDPNFSKTVILLVNYGAQGAMGVIINRPTVYKLSQLLPDIKLLKDRPDILFIGGPVAGDRLMFLVRTPEKPEKAFRIFKDVYVGGDPRNIEKLIDRSDPNERFRAYAGYAGWSPGQLDREVSRGDWHISQADSATVFDKDPTKIWSELIYRFSSKWVNLPPAYNNILPPRSLSHYQLYSE
jgi:putative transcriptional regulator